MSDSRLPRLMNTQQVAQYLNLKVTTLEHWRSMRNKGPKFIRVGGVVQYREADLLAWLEQRVQSGPRVPAEVA